MPKLRKTDQEKQDISFRSAIASGAEIECLTSKEIADAIDVSLPTLRNRKRNPGKCTLDEFRKLCKHLHLSGKQVCDICGVKYESNN